MLVYSMERDWAYLKVDLWAASSAALRVGCLADPWEKKEQQWAAWMDFLKAAW